MTKEFSPFIRRRIRYEILEKAFWIVLLLSPFLFFWVISRGNASVSNFFLFIECVFGLIILFITIPRWRRYYLSQYNYASKFAETLGLKTEELTSALNHLNHNPLPKEIFWINFKIDPATFKIQFETHSTMEESPSKFMDIQNSLESLISVKETSIANLRKKGWGAENNIELSLDMIKMWLSYSWNHVQLQKLNIRSTISIKDRSGYYNIVSNKWEEGSLFL